MRLVGSGALVVFLWLLVAPLPAPAQDVTGETVAAPGGSAPADSAPEPAADEAARGDETEIAALRDRVESLAAHVEALREQLEQITRGLAPTSMPIRHHRLPDTIVFAGEPVPLDRWDVAERLEREFYTALGNSAQVILWLKRSARYFPYIETELRRAGLPDDLKYVAVVESALLPRAYSWAHASGIWQFIAGTARSYGLRVTPSWDERRDPARSTAAALAYLRDLHGSFGDWPLALAAYNAGESRVRAAMTQQGVSTYHQLSLPLETERYFFHILAAKLILADPAEYGFEVPPEERYSPHATEVVPLRVVGHVTVAEIAAAAGSFYRETRALNPAIMGDALPAGQYEIRIPEGRRGGFEAARPELERLMATRRVQRVRYRVKAGDTLGSIARQHGVEVDDIRRWNPTTRRSHIHPGQVISIERTGGLDSR
jgi:hypothetical protein